MLVRGAGTANRFAAIRRLLDAVSYEVIKASAPSRLKVGVRIDRESEATAVNMLAPLRSVGFNPREPPLHPSEPPPILSLFEILRGLISSFPSRPSQRRCLYRSTPWSFDGGSRPRRRFAGLAWVKTHATGERVAHQTGSQLWGEAPAVNMFGAACPTTTPALGHHVHSREGRSTKMSRPRGKAIRRTPVILWRTLSPLSRDDHAGRHPTTSRHALTG